jgi:tetratricopeptide (TPR) repeat protein
VLSALDQPEVAVTAYAQALMIDPGQVEAHNNQGNALQALGRSAEAAQCYRRAIALQPDLPEAHYNLANMLVAGGEPAAAIASFQEAIRLRPDYPEAHNNLGLALAEQDDTDAAAAAYVAALAGRPNYAEALTNLGHVLRRVQRWDDAVTCYRRVAALRSDHAEAHNNLGNALHDLGHLEAAAASCRRAIALDPAYARAHYNLGIILAEQERPHEAVGSFLAALAAQPAYPEALNNLAIAYRNLGQWEDAVACLRRALALRPDFADAANNLGTALRDLGRLAEAEASFRRAIALQPDGAEAHMNLSMALLAQGKHAEGWQEIEWRWQALSFKGSHRDFAQPQWRGEPAAGRTLLLHSEQGFGDTLQFCRFATLAAARGLRVILQVQPSLVRLLQGLAGVAQVIAQGDPLPPFDLHCPTLSMPLALGTTLETVPAFDAYLHAEPAAAAAWQQRLDALAAGRLRVGLVWGGTPALAVDSRRSLDPGRLTRLFDVPDVLFCSLQKGRPVPPDAPLFDPMAGVADFADTAAIVANLDVVISVDTAVAHLAAALGRPVWLLDRFDPCWRWMLGRTDTPWYPSMRIYRQPRSGDWDAVIAAVAADLGVLAAGGRTSEGCRVA